MSLSLYGISPRLTDDLDVFQLLNEWPRSAWSLEPLRELNRQARALQQITRSRESEVHDTDKEFRIRLDLSCYAPEEVRVFSDDDKITVTAKHEEKEEEHGYVKREMTRIYRLPKGKNIDTKSVKSTMNKDGILTIKVDKLALEPPKETPIPVEYKG